MIDHELMRIHLSAAVPLRMAELAHVDQQTRLAGGAVTRNTDGQLDADLTDYQAFRQRAVMGLGRRSMTRTATTTTRRGSDRDRKPYPSYR